MKDNHDFRKSYNRSILFLALLVTVFYLLNRYIPDISAPEKEPTVPKPDYVEIAKEGEPPYVVQLYHNDQSKKFGESYRLQNPPKNGDKLIIDVRDRITLSRIDGRKSLALGVPIGINSASIEDLEALPGIGPKIANRIIEYRESNGAFKNLIELKNIYGIGERKFSSIQELISLD